MTLTLEQAQAQALKFTQDFLSKRSLGLPADMSEEDFAKTMNAVVHGCVSAWVAGWLEGSR
jgi:hypothetical protein